MKMAEMNDIVKIAVDTYKGSLEKYSKEDAMQTLRAALVELNGGSDKLDIKKIRDGKCSGLFSIVEEILKQTVIENIQEDDFFTALVDFRNIAAGDKNEFDIEDADLFVVDTVADGTQAVRRQRIGGYKKVPVPTVVKMVRIYEELSRVLSGRVDFNHLIDVVAASFKNKIKEDIYDAWQNVSANDIGGTAYFPAAGSFSETDLLDVIEHVEAAAGGKTATIIGTKKALRPLINSIKGSSAKDFLDDNGYVGKFYGTPVVAMPQKHKGATTNFAYSDKMITVVAGDQKPIKFVYEGDSLIIPGDPLANMDLTQEYVYADRFGVAVAVAAGNGGIGRYDVI